MEERHKEILSLLAQANTVRIADLSQRFGVSLATIRKDLSILEDQGRLRRTHGGAISLEGEKVELRREAAAAHAHAEKVRIARRAADLVHDGDVFLVQGGSTTIEFAKALHGRHNLTIVTNDIPVALEFERAVPDGTVQLLGGAIRQGFHYTEGAETLLQLQAFHTPTAFMCSDGYSPERGFTAHRTEQAVWRRQIYASADRHVMLLDSTKLGVYSLAHHNDLDDMDVLITDTSASPAMRAMLDSVQTSCQIYYV